ncbi:MAG: FAD-dependent oxidoreductase, partial [Treponema sp.]|nr:FAD-dependent oxidoreductase [Treponema sp.]
KQKMKNELIKKRLVKKGDEFNFVCIKKSIDARHNTVKICLRYKVYIGEEVPDPKKEMPVWKKAAGDKKVIIVGAGPASLFGALMLLEYGIKPIIIERGAPTSERRHDLSKISTEHFVDENSNYCFGEGGAGTFSDGKLYTRSDKRGNVSRVLRVFNHFGASDSILTDSHPHIGTDKLPAIITEIRKTILEYGGEFHFNTKCVDFIFDDDAKTKMSGIVTQNTKTGNTDVYTADAIVLATGHSANDMYALVARYSNEALEAKPFAIGVRVEHPRSLIDEIQHHGKSVIEGAEYKLTTQVQGRGVYSFCMCPGGFVVPSSTSDKEIVVNGMSSARRNSLWSNSAIIVSTFPEDVPEMFVKEAAQKNTPSLAGLYWRTHLEREAKKHGDGQRAPAQRLEDFLARRESTSFPRTSYTPGIVSSRLGEWLPEYITNCLTQAFYDFNSKMKGFISEDALLIAIETRTSTPVRLLRNPETFESVALKNLYPIGEGSGYAGGIMSSILDGEKVCKVIAEKLVATSNL